VKSRKTSALTSPFDAQRIEEIRKGAELIVSNWDKIKSEKDFETFKEGIRPWRNKVRGEYQALMRGLTNAATDSDKVKNVDRTLDSWRKKAKPFFDVTQNVDPYPSVWDSWDKSRATWRDKLQAAIDGLSGVAKWLKSLAKKGIVVELADTTPRNMELSGFPAQLVGFDPKDEEHVEALKKLKRGLKVFEDKTSKAMPAMVEKMVPIQAYFDEKSPLGSAGRLGDGTIKIWPLNIGKVDTFVHTIVHELAHHWGLELLSQKARGRWVELTKEDVKDLDLREVLKSWPENQPMHEWEQKIKKDDPALYLQLQSIFYEHVKVPQELKDNWTRESIEKYLEGGGDPKISVPATPTTPYGATNPNEGFAEALALLIAYGPRAVDPTIRGWLEQVLPGELKTALIRSLVKIAEELIDRP